jgi:hypothetical protein
MEECAREVEAVALSMLNHKSISANSSVGFRACHAKDCGLR